MFIYRVINSKSKWECVYIYFVCYRVIKVGVGVGVGVVWGVNFEECLKVKKHVLGCDGIFLRVKVLASRPKERKVKNEGVRDLFLEIMCL